MADVELEPTTQKAHGLSTTPFVKDVNGVLLIVRLTTCKRLTNSLPKLSLTTQVGEHKSRWIKNRPRTGQEQVENRSNKVKIGESKSKY